MANHSTYIVDQVHKRDSIIFELRQQIRALHKDNANLAELVKKTKADFKEYKKPRDMEGFGCNLLINSGGAEK